MLIKGLCFLLTALNIATVAAENLPDATRAGISQVKVWTRTRVKRAEEEFSARYQRQASPAFWGEQVVYQIQVDRFNNGDSSNDKNNLEQRQSQEVLSGDLFGILDYRHGGDLQGIIDRLDYLKDLGITSLWITPVFKHNGSYHGYCTTDFSQIDPGFGSNEKFRELVQLAHKKGLKVILDIVINHMCDGKTSYSKAPNHHSCSNDLSSKNWNGESGGSSNQGELAFSPDFFAPLKNQFFFNRCGANTTADMQGTGPAAVYGDFVNGMFDFDTRNQDFQKIFTDLHKYWIAYADIDGYRMDAAKHVTEDFVAYFNTEIRSYAATIGKDNFFIVGEVAGPSDWIGRRLGKMYSNPSNPNDRGHVPQTLTNRLWDLKPEYLSHANAPYPGLNAAYDFAHGGVARDVLHNSKSPKQIEAHFSDSYFNDISQQNDYRLSWNLLEIHDWPRYAAANPTSQEKSRLGIAYLALAEGSPIIYYGMEQGFNGDCHFDNMQVGQARSHVQKDCKGHSDALYRQDMFMHGWTKLGSTVPEINALAGMSEPGPAQHFNWQQDPYLNRQHDLYKSSRKLLQIRNSCNGLKYGKTTFRWSDSSLAGILAFSRIDPRSGDEVLAIINTSNERRQIPDMAINDLAMGHRWLNLLNTRENAFTIAAGKITFSGMSLAGNSAMVFVPEANLGNFSQAAQTYLCKH